MVFHTTVIRGNKKFKDTSQAAELTESVCFSDGLSTSFLS